MLEEDPHFAITFDKAFQKHYNAVTSYRMDVHVT